MFLATPTRPVDVFQLGSVSQQYHKRSAAAVRPPVFKSKITKRSKKRFFGISKSKITKRSKQRFFRVLRSKITKRSKQRFFLRIKIPGLVISPARFISTIYNTLCVNKYFCLDCENLFEINELVKLAGKLCSEQVWA